MFCTRHCDLALFGTFCAARCICVLLSSCHAFPLPRCPTLPLLLSTWVWWSHGTDVCLFIFFFFSSCLPFASLSILLRALFLPSLPSTYLPSLPTHPHNAWRRRKAVRWGSLLSLSCLPLLLYLSFLPPCVFFAHHTEFHLKEAGTACLTCLQAHA